MGKFTFLETGIRDLTVIEPTVFGDARGYFMETWNGQAFREAGYDLRFVQDNQSMSCRGVLRGLHFQKKNPQGKLVRVVSGCVWDVAVDLRGDSETCGRWYGVTLSAENKRQFYVPEGFAHGFLVLSDTAVFTYKCTRLYEAADEGGVHWEDPDLGIDWPISGLTPILSAKDAALPRLREMHFRF